MTVSADLLRLRESLTLGDLPQVLTLGQVAAVTGLSVSSIRYRLDAGYLEYRQERRSASRYVPIEAVDELCRRVGIEPYWDALA